VSWVSFRVNLHPEPLFSHYRHVHRRDPRWEVNLLALQNDRFRGVAPRPPVTLVQQTKIVRNNIAQVNNLTLLAPVTKVNPKVVPLTKLNAAQLQQQVQKAKDLKAASVLRAKNETKLAKSLGTVKVGDAPKTLALNLPKTTAPTVVTTKIKNLPPPPTGSKSQLPTGVGTVGSDKGVAAKDKAPAKDKGAVVTKDKTPATDKVSVPKDKAPKADKAPPKDKVAAPKDKTPTIETDKVKPAKDKLVPPKEKAPTIETDKVKPAKDKGVKTDKAPPPKDEAAPVKDKAPAKEKAKDKAKGLLSLHRETHETGILTQQLHVQTIFRGQDLRNRKADDPFAPTQT
jgi:hypothetical protein